MTQVTVTQAVLTRIGTEFKALRTLISGSGTGDVSALTTTATDLVGAVNEVAATAGNAAVINDTAASATTVYSSTKTETDLSAAVANLVNSAPGALDQLNELATALANDPNFATTMTNALALKAPLAAPALTGIPTAPTAAAGTSTTQIATTAFALGVGTAIEAKLGANYDTHDYVADFNAALA